MSTLTMTTAGIIRQIAERIKEVLDAVNGVANNNVELLGEHATVSTSPTPSSRWPTFVAAKNLS